MAKSNANKATVSSFYCTKCGHKGLPVFRTNKKTREPGHLKKIYCLYCKEETNHAECRGFGYYTREDFEIEFNNHNFDNEGNRLIPWKKFVARYKYE